MVMDRPALNSSSGGILEQNRTILSAVSFLLLFTLSSCTLFRPNDTIQAPSNIPSKFSMYSDGLDYEGKWWLDFNSEDLNGLIKEAIDENFTIREAWARLQQSRYAAIKAGAEQFPDISYRAEGLYQEKRDNNQVKTNSQDWTLGLSAGYEVDLWGRVREETTRIIYRAD